jgi:hypothetical protein
MAYINGNEILFSANVNISGIDPSGELLITKNDTYDVTSLASVKVEVPSLPKEIATESEMNALLESGRAGTVYKYTGESTESYENGGIYIIEVVE